MIEAFIDFFAAVVMEAIIGLPALPRNSADWKRRRKGFVIWLTVTLLIVATIAVFTFMNAYRVI